MLKTYFIMLINFELIEPTLQESMDRLQELDRELRYANERLRILRQKKDNRVLRAESDRNNILATISSVKTYIHDMWKENA